MVERLRPTRTPSQNFFQQCLWQRTIIKSTVSRGPLDGVMFERALRTIGTARDAILVAATAAYAAGYVTWALIAWLNNLPPLPLIDAQYLAAGLFPLLSGATFIIIARKL